MEILQLQLANGLTEELHVPAVDSGVVLVSFREDQVEITYNGPLPSAGTADSLQLLHEQLFFVIGLWSVDRGQPPRVLITRSLHTHCQRETANVYVGDGGGSLASGN